MLLDPAKSWLGACIIPFKECRNNRNACQKFRDICPLFKVSFLGSFWGGGQGRGQGVGSPTAEEVYSKSAPLSLYPVIYIYIMYHMYEDRENEKDNKVPWSEKSANISKPEGSENEELFSSCKTKCHRSY